MKIRDAPALYDLDEAALVVGLSPITLSNYMDRGQIDRGIDYVVDRSVVFGRYLRRKRFLTKRGMLRILTRNVRPRPRAKRHPIQAFATP